MNLYLIIITIVTLSLLVYLFVKKESKIVEISHYRISLGEKMKAPLKIIHLSDIHVSPWLPPSAFGEPIDRINSLQGDYIFITGDFVTHFRELVPGCAYMLSKLKAKKGVYFVPGNHDHWLDSEYVTEFLIHQGMNPLINRNFSIKDENLSIIGIDDPYTNRDNLKAALKNAPENNLKILLSHSPDIIDEAKKAGIDLILCGHTHGGQIRLPLIGALYTPSDHGTKFSAGWYNLGQTWMLVNRGLGSVFPPIRTFCRKEIVCLEIIPGKKDKPVKI